MEDGSTEKNVEGSDAPDRSARKMKKGKIKKLLYALLVLLFLLHNDFWLWETPQLVLGLPVGLLYHIGFCLAAMLLMAAFVKARGDWGER